MCNHSDWVSKSIYTAVLLIKSDAMWYVIVGYPIFSSKDRVTCCEFFCEILSRHSSWLGQAGEQFTSILISSYDGETDPRVLINNFGLVSLVQTKGLPGKSKAGFLIDALNPRSFWISSAHLVETIVEAASIWKPLLVIMGRNAWYMRLLFSRWLWTRWEGQSYEVRFRVVFNTSVIWLVESLGVFENKIKLMHSIAPS